jgi:ATP adenylyltransferase/5',5'''-P-1,P-4-tetraphosphate phosphorylase II
VSDKAAQMKYLRDRLDTLMRRKNVFWAGNSGKVKLPVPPEVRMARRQIKLLSSIIAKFERKIQAATDRRNNRKKAAYEACRKEVFFGDAQKALKMLDKFEREY